MSVRQYKSKKLQLEVPGQRGERTGAQRLTDIAGLAKRTQQFLAGGEDRIGMVEDDLARFGQTELPDRERILGPGTPSKHGCHGTADIEFRRTMSSERRVSVQVLWKVDGAG